jgi:hypothetical protein
VRTVAQKSRTEKRKSNESQTTRQVVRKDSVIDNGRTKEEAK